MAAAESPLGWTNLRLTIEYDGTGFHGWQSQCEERTVQGELSRALSTLLGERVVPVASGRTDAGTHALGQVAHAKTRGTIPLHRIHRGLNGLLPPDVAVHRVEAVSDQFHARYDAIAKRYRYRICTDKSALSRNQTWSCFRPLDLEPMRAGASLLVGEHSFAAFCKKDPVPDRFECLVRECEIESVGREVIFEIEANRFLRHMVRIIIGTLVEIGVGRRPASDIPILLAAGDRSQAGPTAPACGLCLMYVSYP
jgi:tRNA pseudouridine38-40 synthase